MMTELTCRVCGARVELGDSLNDEDREMDALDTGGFICENCGGF